MKRAMLLLELAGVKEIRVTDAAAHLGVDKATAHRLLSTLTAGGFLRQDPSSRGYRLGHAVASLGYAYLNAFNVRREGEPILKDLAQQTGETAMLAVLDGSLAVFLAVQETSGQAVRISGRVGGEAPLHASAAGKAILAFRPQEEIDAYVGSGHLRRYTTRTVTDPVHLQAELAEIRRRGYSVGRGELDEGVAGIGVPVCDGNGFAIASLSVCAPEYRWTRKRQAIALAALREAHVAWHGSEASRP